MSVNEKLRKVSDIAFQEMNPPKERNNPLEWRKDNNFISFELGDTGLTRRFLIQELSYDEEILKDPSCKPFEPGLDSNISIEGTVDNSTFRDRFRYAVQDDKDKDIFILEPVKGPIKVNLKSGPPSKRSAHIQEGLYQGTALRMNYEPGEDYFLFDVAIPKEHMDNLAAVIKDEPNAIIRVSAYLGSFTYEVDDAFREPWHPRDFVINSSNPCFIHAISASYKLEKPIDSSGGEEAIQETENQAENNLSHPVYEESEHRQKVKSLNEIRNNLGYINFVLWVLVILAGVALFI